MRRGDDAHINALRLVAAHTFESAFLQDAQQLDLHRQRHVADFVKEQCTAVGQLEAAGTAGDRAGKRALLVSEQLALEQFSRNGTAVDRYKRRITALGVIVQVTCNHFLAGPGLAKDQYAGIGVGDLLHHLPDVLNRAAGTYQTAEQVRLTMTTALTGLVVHLAINLGTVQRVEQLAVAGWHFECGEDSPAQILGQLDRRIFAHQQHGKELIPCCDGLKEPLQAARRVYATDQYA